MVQLPLFPVPTHIERLYTELKMFEGAQVSAATEKGYAHDWRVFSGWCGRMEFAALPASPETLCLFVADQLTQGKRVATVARYAHGVAYQHRSHGYDSPLTQKVKDALGGARRLRHEPLRQMIPLTVEQIRAMAQALAREDTPVALRDRALVLIGFGSALRRWNLAAMELADVTFRGEGLLIRVRSEKQDQEGEGRLIAIPFGRDAVACPVRSLSAWLECRGLASGKLFTRLDSARPSWVSGLSLNAVGEIVKSAVAKSGLDDADYGTHSLRAGLITEAGLAGVSHLAIAAQSGHRSLDSLQRYFRPLNLFKANVCAAIGL